MVLRESTEENESSLGEMRMILPAIFGEEEMDKQNRWNVGGRGVNRINEKEIVHHRREGVVNIWERRKTHRVFDAVPGLRGGLCHWPYFGISISIIDESRIISIVNDQKKTRASKQ